MICFTASETVLCTEPKLYYIIYTISVEPGVRSEQRRIPSLHLRYKSVRIYIFAIFTLTLLCKYGLFRLYISQLHIFILAFSDDYTSNPCQSFWSSTNQQLDLFLNLLFLFYYIRRVSQEIIINFTSTITAY